MFHPGTISQSRPRVSQCVQSSRLTCVAACVRRAAGKPGVWEWGGARATARGQWECCADTGGEERTGIEEMQQLHVVPRGKPDQWQLHVCLFASVFAWKWVIWGHSLDGGWHQGWRESWEKSDNTHEQQINKLNDDVNCFIVVVKRPTTRGHFDSLL